MKYRKSDQPQVAITPRISEAHYGALQRYCGQSGRGQGYVIEKALSRLPGFNQLLKEEKEAYANNQNQGTEVNDISKSHPSQDQTLNV